MSDDAALGSSFRDPSGFIFKQDNCLYRQVNEIYQPHYDHLMESGLYENLSRKGLLVSHVVSTAVKPLTQSGYLVIQPEFIPLITYPYEWSFSQLKDAALLTLYIAQEALKSGMVLKDASAYNVQFRGAFPIFVDTLSFEIYEEGKPWDAYRQFCQHFLAPLALMATTDVRLAQLLKCNLDGIPLDLSSKLLPWRTRLNPGIMTHIHLHASAQNRYAGDQTVDIKQESRKFSKTAFEILLDNLTATVKKLTWRHGATEWADYYQSTNYDEGSFQSKKDIVQDMLETAGAGEVWDLGANTGIFSRLASEKGWLTAAWDIDPSAVEVNYLQTKKEKNKHLIPLVLDLFNPSPAIGWQNTERNSFMERTPVHTIMALALIHHLAISNNVPIHKIAAFFSQISEYLIIEFIPKSDSQVQRLLSTRKDIFPEYSQDDFEENMTEYFQIIKTVPVKNSQRIMYLMRNKAE